MYGDWNGNTAGKWWGARLGEGLINILLWMRRRGRR
jgi:hypothetical protein